MFTGSKKGKSGFCGVLAKRSGLGRVPEKPKPEQPSQTSPMSAVASQQFTVHLDGAEEQFSVLSFIDRRGRKPHRRKQWILVRSIERLLYGVGAGSRSTGAFAAHLSKCSMSDAVLCCERSRVDDGMMKQDELDAGCSTPLPQSRSTPGPDVTFSLIPATPLSVFSAMRPLVDVESRNKIRKTSVVPLTIAVSALSEFGRNDATSVRVALLLARSLRLYAHPSLATRLATSGDPEGAEQAAEEVGIGD